MNDELQNIITEINRLLYKLNGFIDRFNNFVNKTDVSVIADAEGGLSIEVSYNVGDSATNRYRNTINVLDGLINDRIATVENLI